MKTVLLFSYPRSGNTWLRYVIEVLTGRPSLGTPDNLPNDPPIGQRFDGLSVDLDATPSALKRHERYHLEAGDEHRPLMVVVRNYKECIVRHRHFLEEHNDPFTFERESDLYMAPIAYFDGHRPEKLLLYYEDLIENPAVSITRLAQWLGVPERARLDFLNRYEEHRTRSLQHYPAPSFTQGKTTRFHTFDLTPAQRKAWDEGMRRRHPALYDRYLARYHERRFQDTLP